MTNCWPRWGRQQRSREKAAQTKRSAAEAGAKLRRLQDAIAAGVNPVALVDAINAAQAELEAAQVEQARVPDATTISRVEVYAMIDYLGDVGAALKREDPGELQRLYEALNLEITYYAEAKVVEGTVRPGRDSSWRQLMVYLDGPATSY